MNKPFAARITAALKLLISTFSLLCLSMTKASRYAYASKGGKLKDLFEIREKVIVVTGMVVPVDGDFSTYSGV